MIPPNKKEVPEGPGNSTGVEGYRLQCPFDVWQASWLIPALLTCSLAGRGCWWAARRNSKRSFSASKHRPCCTLPHLPAHCKYLRRFSSLLARISQSTSHHICMIDFFFENIWEYNHCGVSEPSGPKSIEFSSTASKNKLITLYTLNM